uniref:Putative secreted peptide n=1 Tax=Anopheles braziliensis TaxID=58242 RepID=A0A2M3ZWW6_9DIPT
MLLATRLGSLDLSLFIVRGAAIPFFPSAHDTVRTSTFYHGLQQSPTTGASATRNNINDNLNASGRFRFRCYSTWFC